MNLFNHRLFLILRVFFPSWRFFESVGEFVRIYIKSGDRENNLSEWIEWNPQYKRKWYHFLWNPEGNAILAYRSLLYQVSYDIHECNEKNIHKFHESASYKLLNNLVIFLLNKNNSRDCFYQFRLSILKVRFQDNKNNNKSEYEETDILTSPLYERLKNVE